MGSLFYFSFLCVSLSLRNYYFIIFFSFFHFFCLCLCEILWEIFIIFYTITIISHITVLYPSCWIHFLFIFFGLLFSFLFFPSLSLFPVAILHLRFIFLSLSLQIFTQFFSIHVIFRFLEIFSGNYKRKPCDRYKISRQLYCHLNSIHLFSFPLQFFSFRILIISIFIWMISRLSVS